MTIELIKSLEKLGLNEKESKIYTAGLELGKFSVVAISEKTGIKRPTCYLILEDLMKKGLITTFPKAKKVLYVAEHPNNLLKNTESAYHLAKQLMPELQGLMGSGSEKPILKVYTGKNGIHNIYEDMLDDGFDLYYITSTKELVAATGKEFIDEWISRRIKKGIKTFRISVWEEEIHNTDLYNASKENLREIRYAPKGFTMPYTIYIYGKKVAFISTKNELFGFIVESSDLSTSMKALFDVVWGVSSEK